MNDFKTPWGNPKPIRGEAYREMAVQFIKDFPIGTTLTSEQFDKWAHQHGYLNVPFDADKKADVWLAHLTRRNQLRQNLYKASTNPNVVSECYVITVSSGGAMIVESPQVALKQTEFAAKFSSLVGTKRKQLGYLMQSLDIQQLPPHQRAIAENLYDELTDWNSLIHMQTVSFDRRVAKLTAQITRDIEAGLIQPKNHALMNLVENKEPGDMPDFLT
jgi:hypothetical protein